MEKERSRRKNIILTSNLRKFGFRVWTGRQLVGNRVKWRAVVNMIQSFRVSYKSQNLFFPMVLLH